MIAIVAIRTPKEDKKCQRSCQSKNPRQAHSSFLVTGVFWRQRFACGGQRFENAKSSDQNDESEEDEKPLINFVAVGQLRLYSQQQHNFSTPGPKFRADNNDATNDAGIQKHL